MTDATRQLYWAANATKLHELVQADEKIFSKFCRASII